MDNNNINNREEELEDKDSISEFSFIDDSSSKKDKNKTKAKYVCDYSKFSSSLNKIHSSIVFLIYSLVFAHSQTLRNKSLKDEEISENDYYLGSLYIITLVISFIIGVNSFFSLSGDFEAIKTEEIFENNFMRSKLIVSFLL